jgi:Flp pilus assembly pilin Flp
MTALYTRIKSLVADQEGQTAVEYALVIGVFILALVAVTPNLVQGMGTFFSNLAATVAGFGNPPK